MIVSDTWVGFHILQKFHQSYQIINAYKDSSSFESYINNFAYRIRVTERSVQSSLDEVPP